MAVHVNGFLGLLCSQELLVCFIETPFTTMHTLAGLAKQPSQCRPSLAMELLPSEQLPNPAMAVHVNGCCALDECSSALFKSPVPCTHLLFLARQLSKAGLQ